MTQIEPNTAQTPIIDHILDADNIFIQKDKGQFPVYNPEKFKLKGRFL